MPEVTLRQRALRLLARREYSRVELGRRLARDAPDIGELESLLDRLETEKLLSSARFAESLTHRRALRYGNSRIVQELREHELPDALVKSHMAQLAITEFERCQVVWQKKFGTLPENIMEKARQARFLSGRGFSDAVIQRVLKGMGPES